MAFLVSLAAAAGLFWDIHLTGKPPISLTIDPAGSVQRSAPFVVHRAGLFLVVLAFDGEAAKAKLDCIPPAERALPPSPLDCASNPPRLSWSISRHGKIIARDSADPAGAVQGFVQSYAGRFHREIGAVRLQAASGYVLEVQPQEGAAALGLVRPVVSIRLHPWDVEQGMGEVLAFWGMAFIAATTGLVMLVIAGVASLKRPRRSPGG